MKCQSTICHLPSVYIPAIGSYSIGPPAARVVGTKSTEGFHRQNWSPCRSLLGRAGSIPSLPLPPSYCGMVLHLPRVISLSRRSLARSCPPLLLSSATFFIHAATTDDERRGRRTKRATREHECAEDNDDEATGSLFLQATYLIFLGRGCALLHICTPRY